MFSKRKLRDGASPPHPLSNRIRGLVPSILLPEVTGIEEKRLVVRENLLEPLPLRLPKGEVLHAPGEKYRAIPDSLQPLLDTAEIIRGFDQLPGGD